MLTAVSSLTSESSLRKNYLRNFYLTRNFCSPKGKQKFLSLLLSCILAEHFPLHIGVDFFLFTQTNTHRISEQPNLY